MRRKRKLKKTIGISATERDELESTISGSFGLEGIIGFKSELRGKLSRELTLEETREEEEEFEFEAPKCGRRIVRVYQLVRIYHFLFRDYRWWRLFRKPDLFKTIIEGVDRIYDRSIEIENDPDCGCHPKPAIGLDGLVNVALGKIGMLVGYKQTKNGLELPRLGITVRANNIHDVFFRTIQLNCEVIPPYLRFLANESAPVLTGEFFPELGLENIHQVGATESVRGYHEKQKVPRHDLLTTLIWGSVGAAVGAFLINKLNRSVNEISVEREAQRIGEELSGRIAAVTQRRQNRLSTYSATTASAHNKVSEVD
jgi:hypothetical protein